MQTECSAERSMFGRVEDGSVVAEFDGDALTSDAGGLLLGAADQRLGLVRRIARCFRDARDPRLVEHSVATLIGQRVFGIALGYEDLNDHDELRHDPLMAVLEGKLVVIVLVRRRRARGRGVVRPYDAASGTRPAAMIWLEAVAVAVAVVLYLARVADRAPAAEAETPSPHEIEAARP